MIYMIHLKIKKFLNNLYKRNLNLNFLLIQIIILIIYFLSIITFNGLMAELYLLKFFVINRFKKKFSRINHLSNYNLFKVQRRLK
jgi:hypothetical protein